MNVEVQDNPVALSNMGAALRLSGEWERARECHYRALQLEMGHAPAWVGLGQIDEDLGQFAAAREHYINAFACRMSVGPRHQKQICLALAQALLRLGEWTEQAWKLWEIGREGESWFPMPGVGRWDGLLVNRLLVTPEGGLGDVLWLLGHVRVLPAAWVGLMCPAEMVELVKSLIGQDSRIRVLGDEADPTDWDAQVPLMGILSNLRDPVEIRTVKAIHARDRVMKLSARDYRKRIGICWTAGEVGVQRPHRSVPVTYLEELKDLDVDWVNLTLEDHPWIGQSCEVYTDGWRNTWASVESCDLVVSTDTSVLHLAGVLGVPTLALVPMRGDWKWLVPAHNHVAGIHGDREHTRWFGSVGLVRQDHPTDWSGVIAVVKEMLCQK